ncbi:MAG: trigger factor [Oscillospiraceae bacterium]|jgi:trigger factor|nr:trigger factor [Oscillospiraceae bacterium]
MILKNVEKKENNTALFTVESDAAEFEAAVNGAYLKAKSSINIPGFRKGKAPRAIVESMYGREVFYQDAMDELAPKAFEQGLSEGELRIVGQPAIDNVEVTEERTVRYTFSVSLYPEVTLGQYKGLKAPKEVTTVSDEEVEEEVEKKRKQNARKVSVEDRPAQMGDTVNIDFDGFLNGERFDGGKAEGYELELGSNSFVPGFEEQVAGMQIGEEKDLDITFPDTYVENLAGKAVIFKVKLNSITFPELPELDDEFAKDVSEFDTLDEYKADLRKQLQDKYNDQAENVFRSYIMKQAADNMSCDVPDVMIQEKAEEIIRNYAANFGMTDRNVELEKLVRMMGIDSETMNQSILPSAQMQVRTELLLEAVAKAEGIELTEEETEAYLQRIADSVNAKPEEIRQYFGLDTIRNEYLKEKATDVIMNSAEIGEMPEPQEAPAEETQE